MDKNDQIIDGNTENEILVKDEWIFERKINDNDPNWTLVETKSNQIMVEISKYDKKVWENYVSNLEKSILLPKNNSLVNTKRNDITIVLKNNKSLNNFKNFKKQQAFRP